jgi:hypothetical protein
VGSGPGQNRNAERNAPEYSSSDVSLPFAKTGVFQCEVDFPDFREPFRFWDTPVATVILVPPDYIIMNLPLGPKLGFFGGSTAKRVFTKYVGQGRA